MRKKDILIVEVEVDGLPGDAVDQVIERNVQACKRVLPEGSFLVVPAGKVKIGKIRIEELP